MKILLGTYLDVCAPGGISKVVARVAERLGELGHDVLIAQPMEPANAVGERGGAPIRAFAAGKTRFVHGYSPQNFQGFRRIVDDFRPDVINMHGYHTLCTPLLAAAIGRRRDVPLVFTPHYDIDSHDTWAGKHLWPIHNHVNGRRACSVADAVIACSRFEADNIERQLRVPRGKIHIIPNGVDSNITPAPKSRADSIRILSAGHLLELKGIQYVIAGVAELHRNRGQRTSLSIIGRGPHEGPLRKAVARHGLEDVVEWRGFVSREELVVAYQEADVFALLSRSENFGIVVAEALAAGTPAVVTMRTALAEFVEEPGCFAVPFPPSPSQVADAIEAAAAPGVRVGPLSARIVNWARVGDAYLRAYEIALRGARI